jgi:DNA-binding MarR family transcriptional regulator
MEASEVTRDGGGALPLLRLEDFLPYRLNVLAAAVSEGLARVYSVRFGIDIPAWRVLATLGQFGPVTSKTIGAHSRMHKTKVSRAVADLESRGLTRRAASSGDRREAIIALTPEGESVYRDIAPLALAYQRELLAGLPPEDAARLDALLDLLAASAAKLTPADAPR